MGFSQESEGRQSLKKKDLPIFHSIFRVYQTQTIGKMDVIRRKISEAPSTPCDNRNLAAAAAAEGDSCEFGSTKYFALCGFGGLLSCGLTHTLVTPLDLVKCRLQVNKEKYKNLGNGFKLTFQEGGASGLFLGWAPTAIGYSMQGICKFGFYEVFKNVYAGMMGEENAFLYRTTLYLIASASAEFFADIALSPMESVKVRIQTSPIGTFPTTLRAAAPKIYAAEGLNGFYKSLVPLWGRQIPYTMMKFACFERTTHRNLCGWLHCWSVLRHCVSSCRHHRLLHEQSRGCNRWFRRQGSWFQRHVGWSWTQDYHDWYTHRIAMVYLRWC